MDPEMTIEENEAFYKGRITGVTNRVHERGKAVQIAVVDAWTRASYDTIGLAAKSREVFSERRACQEKATQNLIDACKAIKFDVFLNLKVNALFDRLRGAGLEFLPEVERVARETLNDE